MSRLLSLLLLYKNGFDAGKYVSFEEQINNYKAYYYESLRQSSDSWESGENSYFSFIENFLSMLYPQCTRAHTPQNGIIEVK